MSRAVSVPSMPTLVLDNGSYTVKLGLGGQAKPSHVLYNCAVKVPNKHSNSPTGSPTDQSISTLSLLEDEWEYAPPCLPNSPSSSQSIYHHDAIIKSPFSRGFVSDWSLQHNIWSRLLRSFSVSDSCLVLADPLFTPLSVRRTIDEAVFEKYGFKQYYRTNPSSLALRGYQYEIQSLFGKPCSTIVDLGQACTTVLPMFNFIPIYNAVRRSSVGGRVLSKELCHRINTKLESHNQTNQSNNQTNNHTHSQAITPMYATTIKEQCCYVSTNFQDELRQVMTPVHHQPLNQSIHQTINSIFPSLLPPLALSPERITVPEAYFQPSLVGVAERGLAETIVQAIEACDVHQRALMYGHIVLLGGGAAFKGLEARVEAEVRALAPAEIAVKVCSSKEPMLTTWCGGSCLSVDPQFDAVCVSKAQFEEHGHRFATKRAWQDEQIEL